MAKIIDKIRGYFDNTDKKIDAVIPMRNLVDENGELQTEFVANGSKYTIMPAKLVFNIKRRRAYEDLHRMFATGKTPTEQFKAILSIKEQMIQMSTQANFQKGISNLWENVINQIECFKNVNNKNSIAYYIASLFIIKDGEDISDWDFETADKKIDDWTKENINPSFFFELALITSDECKEILKAD